MARGVRTTRTWTELMPWSFRLRRGCGGLAEALRAKAVGFDVLTCPRCAGRLRFIALIQQRATTLRPLGLLAEVPVMRRARDPPLVGDCFEELTTSPDA